VIVIDISSLSVWDSPKSDYATFDSLGKPGPWGVAWIQADRIPWTCLKRRFFGTSPVSPAHCRYPI